MVASMRPGSVIVDLAAEAGGNCELTEPGTTVVRENVTIVGTDLRLVERVTGRLTRSRVVRAGALTGAIWGLFIGAVVSLFGDSSASFVVPVITALIGAGFGALSGTLAYSATWGKRDFTSTSGVVATSYEVLCQARFAEDARNLLGRLALRDG